MKIENAGDPEKPLKLHYHLKTPGYAQRTGKRILLPVFFFERGAAPLFSATERKYPIYFPYGWEEHDSVSIQLPPGFALCNPNAPPSLDFGTPGAYKVQIATRGERELLSQRHLVFGRDGKLLFDVETYPQLKKIFDEIHRRDDHTVSLKQTVTAEAK